MIFKNKITIPSVRIWEQFYIVCIFLLGLFLMIFMIRWVEFPPEGGGVIIEVGKNNWKMIGELGRWWLWFEGWNLSFN
jgi:hypothetical protein